MAIDSAQEGCDRVGPFLDLVKDVVLTGQAVRCDQHGRLLFRCLSIWDLASAGVHFPPFLVIHSFYFSQRVFLFSLWCGLV